MCDRILVITGAGISSESGIPTFRGAGERWRDRHVSELATPAAFEEDPRLIWDWYSYRREIVARSEPNAAHIALANWAKGRTGVTLVTQNVDGLHERAGHPEVAHIHGSLWHNRCTECDKEREDLALLYPELPRSPCCGALERPAIVWFGERLPAKTREQALAAAMDAEAIVTIGTSGKVATAASLVRIGKLRHAEIFDVNPEHSCIEANSRFAGLAGEIIPQLLAA
jgi:NAD-dependent deacetylase